MNFNGKLLWFIIISYLMWLGFSIFDNEGSIDPVSLIQRPSWPLPLLATISDCGGWKWTDFDTNSTLKCWNVKWDSNPIFRWQLGFWLSSLNFKWHLFKLPLLSSKIGFYRPKVCFPDCFVARQVSFLCLFYFSVLLATKV